MIVLVTETKKLTALCFVSHQALEELTTSASVPNVWVRGKYIGGCNDGPEPWMGVKRLLKNGQLAAMLKKLAKI